MYIGIDLGTTNSVISFAQVTKDGRVMASPIEIDRVMDSGTGIEGKINYTRSRSKTLPSCVYYYKEDQIIVGDYAREQYKKYPEKVAKSIKSQMGNPATRGLSEEIIDKTPEEISARILTHLRGCAQKQIRQQIKQAIITVPANFDTARREATMKAAEKAGFDVREQDGSWKPILISEPNAVLYDLAQKILNSEVAESVLNFSKKRKVLVFDIGGGTLDVTFHEIERDPENGVTLNISEIAASRFTQLAGDDFDAAIAEELYKRCVDKFEEYEPSAVPRIRSRKTMVKKMLTVAAEQLKINMNASVDGGFFSAADDWFSESFETEEEAEATYNISHSIGDERIYNDTITKSEFEAMLEPFLGNEYTFEDYHNYSKNKKIRRDTIIAPVLDVLEKAARHYSRGDETLAVDAVILNGGMSKLYLIKDRLKKFFNLEPITTADPDLSVANGAAVYAAIKEIYHLQNRITIKRHVQNDDLYLGLSAGVNDLLISTGDELPYTRQIEGYRIVPGTQSIEIPIKRGEESGEPQTIARGVIAFKDGDRTSADLKIEANFDQTGLLAIKAFLYNKAGVQIESGTVEFALGAPMEKSRGGGRIIPVSGAKLIPANEIDALKNLYSEKYKSKGRSWYERNRYRQTQIESRMDTILHCGNPKDFEEVVLERLSEHNEIDFRTQLYSIVLKFASFWSEEGIRRLKEEAGKDIVFLDLGLQSDEKRRQLSEFVKEVLQQIQ